VYKPAGVVIAAARCAGVRSFKGESIRDLTSEHEKVPPRSLIHIGVHRVRACPRCLAFLSEGGEPQNLTALTIRVVVDASFDRIACCDAHCGLPGYADYPDFRKGEDFREWSVRGY
jgi:hypothetical protein